MTGSLVLITGASCGIGRASTLAFAERGDRVIAVARNAAKLEDLARDTAHPERVVPLVADVTDAQSMDAMVGRVLETIGLPDVVVANAGIGLDARFAETTDEDLREVLEVNVVGLVRTVRPFVPRMIDRGSGRILFISSIVGKRGIPHYSAYSASKFALHGIAGALRAELLDTGVTVGLVCPASTETGFQDHARRAGPPQRRVRPRRHSADSVARAIVSMADSARPERVLGIEARLLALADRIAPRLVDRLLGRTLRPRD
jgi:short-subunit dehydrogenase